jgi:Protein of unknown function (DUF3828)
MPAPTGRNSVLSRRFLALVLLAVPAAAAAQEQTPQQFLTSIYEPYRKADFKGQPYWEVNRWFAPDLANAIDKDFAEAKKRKEVPTLDGDPFVDAQDWKIDSLAYATALGRDKAAAAVTFTNFGEPKGAVVSLVKTPAGWRISNIVTANGSLRTLFKLK